MCFKQTIRRVFPRATLHLAHDLKYLRKAVAPTSKKTCPLCYYHGFFDWFGTPPRVDAICPNCNSLERHRLFWLWLKENVLAEPVLHFAPEAVLETHFRKMFIQYRTADLFAPSDIKLNLESIDLPSESYSTIICNHVLEHVNDRLALKELYRILTSPGVFILTVPIIEGWNSTYEDDEVSTGQERQIHFGQSDHVRFYGSDIRERITTAGFKIEEYTAQGLDVINYGLWRGEKIFVARK
jgi:SAM-dependent methyltransferase